MELFKVVVAGGRTFSDYELLRTTLDSLLRAKRTTHHVVIISGAARGADKLGERYSDETEGVTTMQFFADWDNKGRSAGYLRNAQMASTADAVVVFWDGKSKGSKHMVDISKAAGLPLRVVRY